MQEEIFEGRDIGGFYISDGCSASQYLLFITCVRLGWVRKLDLNKVRLSNQCKRRDLKAAEHSPLGLTTNCRKRS